VVREAFGRGVVALSTKIAGCSEVAEMVCGMTPKLAMLLRVLEALRELGDIALLALVTVPSRGLASLLPPTTEAIPFTQH
jgi:hypothetical protein